VLVVALRVADRSRAADALREAAASAAGATLLAPVSDDALETLEGDFAGHAVGILSFADLDAARAGWQAMLPALQARATSLQAYALPRTPGG